MERVWLFVGVGWLPACSRGLLRCRFHDDCRGQAYTCSACVHKSPEPECNGDTNAFMCKNEKVRKGM